MFRVILAAALLVPVSQGSVDLIVSYEVGSQASYEARYQRPIWPRLRSGPTVGIGSDLGTKSAATIRATWADHPQVERLTVAAGVTGKPAKALTAMMQDVVTPWALAMSTFERVELVRYWRIARRSFGDGFMVLSDDAQGVLTSVVYNRGGSTTGPSRREYRVIRDKCIPARDEQCIAEQIVSMCRIWRGGELEKGLCGRRNAEAALLYNRTSPTHRSQP